MIVVGCDPGVDGSCAIIDTAAPTVVTFIDLPLNDDRELDAHGLFMQLLDLSPDVFCTELTFRQPKLQAMTGELKAIAKILQVNDLIVVPVSTWKRKVLGVSSKDKQISVHKAQQLYPTAAFVKPRCRTVSHDRCEALLLAHYYLVTHGLYPHAGQQNGPGRTVPAPDAEGG